MPVKSSQANAKRESHRRIYVLDGLRMPRVWMHGPKWRRLFDVREVLLVDLLPPSLDRYFDPRRKALTWSFEDDIRELIQDEIRPGVYAQWSDPLERIGLSRSTRKRRNQVS